MQGQILWTPDDARIRSATLWHFAERTNALHHCAAEDYLGLHDWSVKEPAAFHNALWDFLGIVGQKGSVVYAAGRTITETKFYPEARVNYAENMLRNADDRLAIVAHRDAGTRREITRKELYDLVSRITQALEAEGVGVGDRLGAIVTNDIESIAAYLACSAIGAIWSSCSPDFGPAGASDRLNQVAPKVLFAVPGYSYAGKQIDVTASINAVAAETSVQRIVLLGEGGAAVKYAKPATTLSSWVEPFTPTEIDFDRGAFDRPMVILFSSGTTGKPKGIVHSGGGLLIQHLKEQVLHCDIKSGDRVFYFTTCGWMMWHWLISGLAIGATLVTYDGNPFHPQVNRLADLIDQDSITVFGTSAKFIDGCAKAGVRPRESHKLTSLKSILSTGSPLLPESFNYIYRDWKSDLHLASISGGTDICGCFVGGVPIWPVRRGEIQGALLGMDVDAVDEDNNPVLGSPGELVCRNAHVSMPVFFWGDSDGSRYRDAYFARFENIWAHGDHIEKRPSGGFVIYGRSDTTLNPGGVRIGTAEIYRQVESIDQVLEAIAVGQDWDGDQRVVLFVKMRSGAALDEDLVKRIRQRIRSGATPRHVPAEIVAVPDIPRTRSGKISESAARDSINGEPIKNTTALANPECLEFYRAWRMASRRWPDDPP